MAYRVLTTVIAALLCSNLVSARKTYLVKTERNLQASPRVRDYDYIYCPKKNDDTFVCLDLSADLSIGWQFYQKQVPGSYYQISFQIYSDQSFNIHPEFSYPRAMYLENTYELPAFQEIFGFEFIYYYYGDFLCFNIYRQNEYWQAQWLAVIKTMACYKNFINCLHDWKQWKGEDAKWFNGCAQSSKEEITAYQYTKEKTNKFFKGDELDVQVYGTSCSPGTGPWPFLMFGPVVTQGGRPTGESNSQIGAKTQAMVHRMIVNFMGYLTRGGVGSGELFNLKDKA